MSLYQKSVLSKYIRQHEDHVVKEAYQRFQDYFHNPKRQVNIRRAKEEQFQEGFLRELFVNILGYTINPEPDYNLTTEFKNEKGAKKADGAILVDGKAIGVIELKGTDTKDLDKINDQAFSYKNNQSNCVYVITSNFEKLRFFIENAVEHEEFNLFELTEDEFKLIWLCLQKDNLLAGIPHKIKEESLLEEEKVTKRLYTDYSAFKRELWEDMVNRNSDYDEMLLFKKSQKLLDRFLFIFFSEDKGLLPPNSTSIIIEDWDKLKELDEYKPLYDRFKKYFTYMNEGFKGKKYEIHAYNGGLFREDKVLDSVVIDDEVLRKHTMKLTEYDFDSEVDVNILGHIFEHSLSEIENVRAQLEGIEVDKSKTKRKKDGVFYTPKYITKYIVDNTVRKLCEQKKVELGITEERFKEAGRRTKKGIKDLEDYREWLLGLTICDPACGSGAFLNQALGFLINEHAWLDEIIAEYHGHSIVFPDVEKHILENNLYGVDINEESIEIAKLSLWLHTAKPGRRLTALSDYIKCGNSLIDDPAVAGNKAFNWKKEFPKVFDKGGFDVVIGNPPYVPTEYISEQDKIFLEKTYSSAFGRINLYPIFYEKGIQIIRENGVLSFITPYTITKNLYYKEARKYILENTSIDTLIDFKDTTVFEDAAVDSIILTLRKEKRPNNKYLQISNIKNFQTQQYDTNEVFQNKILKSEDLSFNVSLYEKFISRISKNCYTVSQVLNFNQGIITGGNSKFLTKDESALTKKLITGSDFNRYYLAKTNNYIVYDTERLHRPRKKQIFEVDEKILLRQTGAYPICMIDTNKNYTLDTVHNGLVINENFNLKYLLALLNSRLLRFLYENSINESGKVFAQVKIIYIDPLPIKNKDKKSQQSFIEKVDSLLKLNAELQGIQSNFIDLLRSKFDIDKLNKKLQNWHKLDFKEFLKELKKAKVQLTLSGEAEWMQYFNDQKQKARELKAEIDMVDKDIDQMVYKLYDLTEEEIEIIENNVK